MDRSPSRVPLLLIGAVAVAVVGLGYWLWRGDAPAPVPNDTVAATAVGADEPEAGPTLGTGAGELATDDPAPRRDVAAAPAPGRQDAGGGRVRLTGRLVRGEGQPVGGVEVGAIVVSGDRLMARLLEDGVPQRRATSGDDGRFAFELELGAAVTLRIDDRRFFLRGEHPTRGRLTVAALDEDRDLGDVAVGECGMVRGQVVDGSGRGVPDVTVRAGGAAIVVGLFDADGAVRTDKNGEFTLRGLLPGRQALTTASPDWLPARAEIELSEGEQRDAVRIAVEAGARIAGTVVDDTGRPVSGARVAADRTRRLGSAGTMRSTNPAEAAVTDAAGKFHLRGVDGAVVNLTVWADGHAQATQPGIAAGTEDVVLRLSRLGRVEGSVVDERGEPVAGARVRAVRDGDAFVPPRGPGAGSAVTDGSGAFTVADVEPGTVVLVAADDSHREVRSTPLQVGPGQRVDGVRMVMARGGVVAVRVSDHDGKPVAGASCVLRTRQDETVADSGRTFQVRRRVAESEGRGNAVRIDGDGIERTVRTDAEGKAEIAGLPAGEFELTVRHPRYAAVVDGPIAVSAPGARTEREVQLTPGGFVQVQVDDAGGAPLPGATVRAVALAEAGAGASGETDGRGTVRLGPLVPGAYRVELRPRPQAMQLAEGMSFSVLGPDDEQALVAREVEVRAENTADVRLQHPPVLTVRGTVRDTEGAVSGARLSLSRGGGVLEALAPLAQARTDGSGSFTLDGVLPGDYVLSYGYEDSPVRAEKELKLTAADLHTELELQLETGTVRMQVVDDNGEPVAGARATLRRPGRGAGAGQPRPRRMMMVTTTVRRSEGGPSGPQSMTFNAGGSGVETSDVDGWVRFAHVPVGSYEIELSHDRHARTARPDVVVLAGATADLGRVTMAAGGRIAGTVKLPDGSTPGLCSVEIEPIDGTPGERDVTVAQGGSFRFTGLAAGRYRVRAGEMGLDGPSWGEPRQVELTAGARETIELGVGGR